MVTERKKKRKKKEKTERQWKEELEDLRRMYEHGGRKENKSEEEK